MNITQQLIDSTTEKMKEVYEGYQVRYSQYVTDAKGHNSTFQCADGIVRNTKVAFDEKRKVMYWAFRQV